ncbi:MAG: AAA family ATPase [Negativicutes bacterium]
MNIIRGVIPKAQKIIVYGPEGIGKSTFAAQFPAPLFIDTEGSTNHMEVARLPKPSSWTMLLSNIAEVKNTPGCCKTLVVDTIDWAEQLCVTHVCATGGKKGIEDFSYGKGYVYVKEEIGRFLNLLSDVIECGINVVLTAHAQIRKFELPDECGSYDRYELKLGNKTGGATSQLVKEWADMVLFANYKQYVVEVNEKKKAQGGSRVMHTQHHPCWDAKNRCGLKPELPFDFAQIAGCLAVAPQAPEKAKPETRQETRQEAPPTSPVQELVREMNRNEKPATEPAAKAPDPVPETKAPENKALKKEPVKLPGVPKPLADLMTKHEVKIDEIQNVVAIRGYYPHDTPIDKYDAGFIDGVLVGAWDQVYAMIVDNRNLPY